MKNSRDHSLNSLELNHFSSKILSLEFGEYVLFIKNLHEDCKKEYSDRILEHAITKNFDINAVNNEGLSLSLHAIKDDEPVVLSSCCRFGADMNVLDKDGWGFTDYVFYNDHENVNDFAEMYVKNGGNPFCSIKLHYSSLSRAEKLKGSLMKSIESNPDKNESLMAFAIGAISAGENVELAEWFLQRPQTSGH